MSTETASLIIPDSNLSWLVYPVETIIAEKMHALISHGDINSRSKDVYDLATLLPMANSAILAEALKRCFEFRQSELPNSFANVLKSMDTKSLERGWRSATASLPDKPLFSTTYEKIFLPGLDDVTAEYASKQLGETTIFSKTFQDFPGKKQDNTRYAEQKRALMLPNEIRQTAAHSEVLIISDTAPPIRAAYPPFAVHKNTYSAANKGTPREIHLGDIDPQFSFTDSGHANQAAEHDKIALKEVISSEVDRICSNERLSELAFLSAGEPALDSLEHQFDGESAKKDPVYNALNNLPVEVGYFSAQGNRGSLVIEHASI